MAAPRKIAPLPFFSEWAGHPLSDLALVKTAIETTRPGKPIVFLAGDSSLDNKAWVPSNGAGGEPLPVPVPDIFKSFLDPPNPKPDVSFWLNHFLGSTASVINAAVEASLLREREESLLHHDEFIRDNIRPQDVLVVSLGANDIALSPTAATMRHMLQLAWLTSKSSIEQGTASSLQHFRQIFGDQTKEYIFRLISKQKPRGVIVCMTYFPLEARASEQSGWADAQLRMLGYGRYPSQLQAAIRELYKSATTKIEIEGTSIVPCALFESMDGTYGEDYVARVEPSVEGGRKMAELLKAKIDSVLSSTK